MTSGDWVSSAITANVQQSLQTQIKTSQQLEDHPQNYKLSWKDTTEVESMGLIGDRMIGQ